MKKSTTAPFSYTNRKGQTFYVHQGTTKLGKVRFFTSKSKSCALSSVPEGLEVREDLNGVVSVAKPIPSTIPSADLNFVEAKVASLKHLADHRVTTKGDRILIHRPLGVANIDKFIESSTGSTLAWFTEFAAQLGRDPKSVLSKVAADAGLTIADLKRMDAEETAAKKQKAREQLRKTVQYEVVMRFERDLATGRYHVDRRCYRGDRPWYELGTGTLKAVANKYIKHIGKDSLFELF